MTRLESEDGAEKAAKEGEENEEEIEGEEEDEEVVEKTWDVKKCGSLVEANQKLHNDLMEVVGSGARL